MKVNIKLLDDKACLPYRATDGAGYYDIKCFDGEKILPEDKKLVRYRTGLALEIPEGYVMQIYPRSSLYLKYGLTLANNVAVIDSDYRGEVILYFKYDSTSWAPWKGIKCERLVQACIVEEGVNCEWNVVNSLSETKRGSGGFGSTGGM